MSADFVLHSYALTDSTVLITGEQPAKQWILRETRGRVSGPDGAAARLGVPSSTLESRIRALRINKHAFRADA